MTQTETKTMTHPRLSVLLLLGAAIALPAQALPVIWTLTDVEFDDGGTATGSFIYDADSGIFSNVALSTVGGFAPGGDYADVLFGADTDALLVFDAFDDLTGAPALQLIFQTPLTNAGGFVDLTFIDPFFSSFEQTCFDSGCFSAGVDRTMVSGGLVGTVVPLPAAGWLLVSGLGAAAGLRRRARR